MCQWEKNALRRKMECFWLSERGNQVPKDFSFMGSKRYCVNCILPAIPFASALCEWKQLPFIPRFLLRCLLQGISYYVEDCPSYYFPWKPWNDESSAWFPIWGPLKSIFPIFMFYVCFLDFFHFLCWLFYKYLRSRSKNSYLSENYHDIQNFRIKNYFCRIFWSSFFPLSYSEPNILQTCGCFGNKV